MSTQNTTRRLTPTTLQTDLDSYHGLQTIPTYATARPEAKLESIQVAHAQMIAKQQEETERQVMFKAAANAARLAEWEFHNTVLAMKEAVKGQFGSDSDEAVAVGYKKKSDRKRPTKRKEDV